MLAGTEAAPLRRSIMVLAARIKRGRRIRNRRVFDKDLEHFTEESIQNFLIT